MPTITVPGQGDVDFPDSMSEADITAALKKIAPPPADQPGLATRALRALTTPFKAMQSINDRDRATTMPGPLALSKDSGDIRAGLQAVLSGVPGYQPNAESADAQDRMDRFRREHRAASILLPLAGGLAKPGALPAAAGEATQAGPITRTLTDVARKAERRTLYGGAETLSTKYPVTNASLDAAPAGTFKPLGTTEHAANVLSDALDEAGSVKGDVVQAMEAAGIKGPDSANMAQLLRYKAAYLRKNSAGTNLPEVYEGIANDIENAGEGGRLGVQQAENIKTSLQKQAKYGRPEETLANIERRKIASTMRQGVEDASGADAATLGGDAAAADAALVPSKNAYALLAPAAKAAEKGLSQSVKRNAFSLRDVMMAGPMLAAHGPLAAAEAGLVTKALRTYGPSTVAWGARKAAGVSGKMSGIVDALVARGVPQNEAEAIAQAASPPARPGDPLRRLVSE